MEIREITLESRPLLIIIQIIATVRRRIMLITLVTSIRQLIIPVVATMLRNQARTIVEPKIQTPILATRATAVLAKTVQIQTILLRKQILRIQQTLLTTILRQRIQIPAIQQIKCQITTNKPHRTQILIQILQIKMQLQRIVHLIKVPTKIQIQLVIVTI